MIPLLDTTRALPPIREELMQTFARVLDSGHYILGPEVETFEAAAAKYCGTKYALGVSSGTDALLLALMALDIGAGDDVLCPTYTFFATAGTVARLGAKPVFVDACPGCYNAHPAGFAQAHTPETRALIPVHLFGQAAAMERLVGFATTKKLPIVEDAAQAIGTEYGGRRAGALGKVGCFSFFPSKNLGAFGDAGLVTTNDTALFEKLKVMRVHGGAPKYFHSIIGGNFRIDALQAALLAVKLPHLDAATAKRQANAALYDELFAASGRAAFGVCLCDDPRAKAESTAPLGLPWRGPNRHIYNQYTVRIRSGKRDAVRAALSAQGIGNEVYYPVPMHLQPCFAGLGHAKGDFPHAEAAAAETLALPIFPELTEQEVRRVAAAVLACIS